MGKVLKIENERFRRSIVNSARSWVGTAYAHQASLKGVGCDCLGLVRGIWRECYGAEPIAFRTYTTDWNVKATSFDLAVETCKIMDEKPIETARGGDLALFSIKRNTRPTHLGVLAGWNGAAPSFIHAYSLHGVVESSLTYSWRRRIAHVFSFPARSN